MKNIIAVLVLLLSSVTKADEVLGIQDGTYLGRGRLESRTLLVPSVNFKSRRTLENGVVTVTSSVLLFNHPAVSLSGKLKFVPRSETHIDIYNLAELTSGKPSKAGEATCEPRSCTFTATLNNGKFSLTETWVRDGDGFRVLNGSQYMIVGGVKISGVYEAEFVPAR